MTESKLGKPCLPYGWIVKQSKSYPDRVYYFNTLTGATTWAMPDLVHSSNAQDKDDPFFDSTAPDKSLQFKSYQPDITSFKPKRVLISGESFSDSGSNIYNAPTSPTKPRKSSKHSPHGSLAEHTLNYENNPAHRQKFLPFKSPPPDSTFTPTTGLVSNKSLSDSGISSSFYNPPVISPSKKSVKSSEHSYRASVKEQSFGYENRTAHRSTPKIGATNLFSNDYGDEAYFSPEPESDNSLGNLVESDEDEYSIDLEDIDDIKKVDSSKKSDKSNSKGTKIAPIHILDDSPESPDLRKQHKGHSMYNSISPSNKNRHVKANVAKTSDSDCQIIEQNIKRKFIDKNVSSPKDKQKVLSKQNLKATCDVEGYEGRKKRKIIDSIGSLLCNMTVPNIESCDKNKDVKPTLIASNEKLSDTKAVEGRKKRKFTDSTGTLLQRIEKQEKTIDLREKLNAKRKNPDTQHHDSTKRQKIAKTVSSTNEDSSSPIVISSEPQIEDPQKLKAILTWIDTAEPSTSELTETAGIVVSDDSPKEAECEDNRRVVLTTGRTFLKAPDSGYSTISNLTSVTAAANEKALLGRGTPGQFPLVNNTDRDVMGMEVDDVQYQMNQEERMVVDDTISLEALKEMRQKLQTVPDEVLGVLTQSVSEETISKQTKSQKKVVKKNLNIVVDTNVFMHDLSFIEELKDFPITGYGKPTLVVPWVVLQELDALKANKRSVNPHLRFAVERKARLPVNFLQSCLSSHHPRVVGQTPLEAQKVIGTFSPDCNDDRILQCCLQWKDKYCNSLVILLSNDVNLCNKAIVCGVRAFNTKNLLCGLENTNKANIKPQQKSSSKTSASSVGSVHSLKTSGSQDSRNKPDLHDEVYCKMKLLLRESLGPLLEQEMKNIYDDIWLNIVVKKPPWTVNDILECFKKHWMAVFGFIFKRKLQANIDRLLLAFCPGKGFNIKGAKLIQVLTDAIEVLDEAVSYADYGSQVTSALNQLKKLQSLYCDNTNKQNLSSLESWLGNAKAEKPPEKRNPECSKSVEIKFQHVWGRIQNFCISLKQLSETNNPDMRQTKEAFEILSKLLPILKELRSQYSLLLFVPVSKLSSKQEQINSLCQELNTFFMKINVEDDSEMIYGSQLQEYFSNSEKRPLLTAGLNNLDVMLRQIYNYVAILPDPQESH